MAYLLPVTHYLKHYITLTLCHCGLFLQVLLMSQAMSAQVAVSEFEIHENARLERDTPELAEVLAITRWKKSNASTFVLDNHPFLIKIPLDSVLHGDSSRILSVASHVTLILYQKDGSKIPVRKFRKNAAESNDRISIVLSASHAINGYFIGLVQPRMPWFPSISPYTRNWLRLVSTPVDKYHIVNSHYDRESISAFENMMYLILGGTLMLGCYFALLYFSNREEYIFGIYATYLFFNAIYWAERILSIGLTFFTRNIDQTVTNTISQIGFHVAFALLAHELLNFRKFYPRLGKLWRIFAISQLIYAIIFTIGMYSGADPVILLNSFAIERSVIGLVAILTILYFVFTPHNVYCYFLGFASFSFVVSALSALVFHDIRLYILGLSIEILTFSLAIGHKIRKSDEARIESEKSAFMLEREVSRTKDAALRAQMNPHFVSNVINALRALILDGENKQAYNYLSRFAHVVRTMLSSADKQLITLQEELRLVKDYVALEELRFGRKVSFITTLDDEIDIENYLIPPMLLQPLVENAMHHGLFPLTEREPFIKLNLQTFDGSDKLKISVEDNGIGRDKAAETQLKRRRQRPSMAMNIIRERIKLLQEGSSHASRNSIENVLHIEDLFDKDGEGIGTKITLEIPKTIVKDLATQLKEDQKEREVFSFLLREESI